jgi:hypothetical protein
MHIDPNDHVFPGRCILAAARRRSARPAGCADYFSPKAKPDGRPSTLVRVVMTGFDDGCTLEAVSRARDEPVAKSPWRAEDVAGEIAMVFPALVMAAALAAAPTAAAWPGDHNAAAADSRPVTLVPGIQGVHFAISTRREDAQKFFDQGLAFIYAFNHDEAVRSFRRAAEIDPASPMPWWGVALALGPNINLDVDAEREKAAYDAVQKAVALAVRAPGKERAYVTALVKRYSNDPKAD